MRILLSPLIFFFYLLESALGCLYLSLFVCVGGKGAKEKLVGIAITQTKHPPHSLIPQSWQGKEGEREREKEASNHIHREKRERERERNSATAAGESVYVQWYLHGIPQRDFLGGRPNDKFLLKCSKLC